MSLDHHIYGSTDWHLPSPSSTPKSVTFPDSALKTPKTEAAPQSHFLDAWSTPRVNGQQTPAQTPIFALSTPIERPSSSYSQTFRTPEDPAFHVNHFASHNLPLPPVDPARRLSSSPGPLSAKQTEVTLRGNLSTQSCLIGMDTSQMRTPPPTRDANSRRAQQQQGVHDFSTPATVIARTPGQVQTTDNFYNQTPLGFPSLQFSPDLIQFPSTGPMSAPALPHSRLFWDQSNDGSNMDVDMPLASDPFGPTPHKIDGRFNWPTPTFHTPANQMNPQAFQALHGMSSPGPIASFATSNASFGDGSASRSNSFVSAPAGVDPSMLFSFSSPGPSTSFGIPTQQTNTNHDDRQPYGQQVRDSLREREMAKKAKSQHSRTSTTSSTASFDNKPSLQRSNTDSGFRKSRPSSMESRVSGSAAGTNIPRRSSPLKRQSGGSLMSIPEVRRPRTRLVIDENGRARTETVSAEEDESRREAHRETQNDLRRQYPGLYAEDDSESESDEQPVTLSRNASFNMPQRRTSKHARADSGDLQRSSSFKAARPSSGVFDKSSFETIRPVRKSADNAFRRFSMMDFPTSFNDTKDSGDQVMPNSPGDALGALKKVVEGRQKRIERTTQNTLKAHNQRWADLSVSNASPHGLYDPYNPSFSVSPATNTDVGLTTPSTDRSSLSNESTRCICNSSDDGRPMVQCESCNKWLHMDCVGLSSHNLPPVYVCIICTGQTPIARGGRVRGPMPPFDSPLTHKSVFRR
ncbi:hypothetical protein K491DRAFT_589941 [Lophiostoma macrostomum CBS 122681]|uniref:PHD-type domain-containing protein n=1 Tax=Lophiostoma macrostomum CBS 122681 TaxID=1314788 RepID=A0A6A6TJ46_9PLEO|nr:hypothetical protein K491DRAFT_589941 [Lophiostoma macrostomum CBS 122681]